MQLLAENSTYTVSCDMKIAGQSSGLVRFYFDKSQKMSRGKHDPLVGMSTQPHHRMNLEDEDNRRFSKDRWPIPLRDTKFLSVG